MLAIKFPLCLTEAEHFFFADSERKIHSLGTVSWEKKKTGKIPNANNAGTSNFLERKKVSEGHSAKFENFRKELNISRSLVTLEIQLRR